MTAPGAAMAWSLAAIVQALAAAAERRNGPVAGWEPTLAALRVNHPKRSGPAPLDRALTGVAEIFAPAPSDLDLLLIAAAAELDATIALAYGLLAGGTAPSWPTVGLALELAGISTLDPAGRRLLHPAAPLRRHRLLQVGGEGPWPTRLLRIEDRVLAHLLGEDTPDPEIAAMTVESMPLSFAETPALARALDSDVPLAWVVAAPGAAGTALACGVFAALGLDALVVDLARRPPAVDADEAAVLAAREAGLLGAGLVLLDDDSTRPPVRELADAAVPALVVSGRRWDPDWLPYVPPVLDAPALGAQQRRALWAELLPDCPVQSQARLTPERIVLAAGYARQSAQARDVPVSAELLQEAIRHSTGGIRATPQDPAVSLEDLVLPDPAAASLRSLIGWVRHRDEVLAQGPVHGRGGKGTGITAMFTGNPGTGKTLAAHVVAAELGMDLLQIDLPTVIDKYIGETEKNLERIFHEAENVNVVLFFDEADALFGARSDVHDARDRYANQEVSYLLQRMERFDGVTILATNLRGNLDAAFSRRMHFIVPFPDPDPVTRRRLWGQHLSHLAALDEADPVDLRILSEAADFAGGDIRNVVLAAAYQAAMDGGPVGMRHLSAAITREYRKLGRLMPASEVLG